MKKNFIYLMLFVFGVLGLVSCAEDMEYNNNGTVPVKELLVPAADAEMVLINNEEATTLFEWTVGDAVTTQKYYVVFYNAATGGKELFRIDNGQSTSEALISHDILSDVASRAGIAPDTAGDLYWNVIAYNGNNEAQPTTARNRLTVVRYGGIEDAPSNLYMGGIADLAEDAAVRTMAANGEVFDIYARFTSEDNLYITNRGDGTVARRFYIAEQDGATVLVEGEGESVKLDGVYHIQVDLGSARVKLEKIEGVALHWCWTPNYEQTAFEYQGLGTFKLANYTIPTGDSRYRFRALVNGVEYIWGAPASNDAEPTTLDGNYFDLVFTALGTNDQWGYKYKFMGVTRGQTCDVYIHLGARNYHVLDFGNIVPNPATAIETPAALAASTVDNPLDLNTVTEPFTFSWTVEEGEYKIAPKYRVIFSHDGVAVETIESEATSIVLEPGRIDNILDKIGIAAGESATLTWKVEAYILNNTAAQTCDEGVFTAKRMSLPTALYLTGAATEFGEDLAAAQAMNIVGKEGSGQFIIYTKLTAGAYRFATSNGADAKFYVLNGGKLIPGEGTIQNDTEAVYRITANVAAKSLTLEAITNVQLRNEGNGNWTTDFQYIGGGVWSAIDPASHISRIGWWGDRYYFAAFAADVEELWGYSRSNNDAPEVFHTEAVDPTAEDCPPQYIYIQKRGTIPRWDYTFKDGRGQSGFEHTIQEMYLHMNGNEKHNHPFYSFRAVWGSGYSGDRNAVHQTEFTYIANEL